MDFTTLAGTAVQKGLGNIVKAKLIFYEPTAIIKTIKKGALDKNRKLTGDIVEKTMSEEVGSGAYHGVAAQNILASRISTESALVGTGNGVQVSSSRLEYGDKSSKKVLEVQFNPATLRLTARGGGRNLVSNAVNDKTNEAGGKDGNAPKDAFSYQRLNPFVEISFKLIFDQEINSDAFMRDKLTFNATNVVKEAASLIRDKDYTVQPMVEGFIGAVRSNYHRMMAIAWGPLEYAGMLNSVNSRYTMFSPIGNPIRAEVDFNLYCANMDDNFNNWEQKYADAVGGARNYKRTMIDSDGYEEFKDNTSILGNFLNL